MPAADALAGLVADLRCFDPANRPAVAAQILRDCAGKIMALEAAVKADDCVGLGLDAFYEQEALVQALDEWDRDFGRTPEALLELLEPDSLARRAWGLRLEVRPQDAEAPPVRVDADSRGEVPA